MSHRISYSVGQNGKNQASDVKVVQQLLNGYVSQLRLPPVPLSGRVDSHTAKVIVEFQRRVAGLGRPDGLVDPNGPTWKKLAARPPVVTKSPEPVKPNGPITISGKVSQLPSKAVNILKEILQTAELSRAEVTSVTRTPEEQAHAMFVNIKNKGVDSQLRLYKSPGRQVIRVYVDNQDKSDSEIKRRMVDKIVAVGSDKVSLHCSKSHIVFDVAPTSIANKSKFVEAVLKAKSAGKIHKYLGPGDGDPAYHIEIPK